MTPSHRSRPGFGAAATSVLVAALLIVLPAAGARAHSALEPREVAAGAVTEFTLTIPHGCTPGEPPPDPGEEISPTIEVSVRFPVDARDVEPLPASGWETITTQDDDRLVVTWEGGQIAPDEIGTFAFTATLYGGEGDEVAFEVFQGCVEGEYRWIEVEEDDSGDPLDQPAPTVVLTSSQEAPAEPAPATTTAPAQPASPSPAATASPTSDAARPDETATPAPTPTATGEAPAPGTQEGDSSTGLPTTVLAAIVVLALGGVAVAALRGRRG